MMNAIWNSVNREITGKRFNGEEFHGIIRQTRAKSGTDIQLQIEDLDTGETFLESGLAVANGDRNLHIFF
jgi:hypothetical protein